MTSETEQPPTEAPVASEIRVELPPVAEPPPPETAAPQADPNPVGTCDTIVGGCGLVCELAQAPLTDVERDALRRDLLPVLVKHRVQEMEGAEEWKLGLTTLGVAWPRRHKLLALLFGDETEEKPANAAREPGKEGGGEKRPPASPGMALFAKDP